MSVRLTALALALAGLALAGCASEGGGPAAAHRPSPTATEERPATATATPTAGATAGSTPRATPAQPGPPTRAPASEPATAVDLTFSGSLTGRVRTANASNPCGKAIVGGYAVVLNLSVSGQASVLSIELLDYHGPGTYAVPPERVSLRVGSPPGGQFLTGMKGSVTIDGTERAGKIDATLGGGEAHVTGAWACT